MLRPMIACGLLLTALLSAEARADSCSGAVVLAGKKATLSHCAVAWFDDQKSATIWFDEQPIAPAKVEAFQTSSYASEAGHRMLTLAFCPAGTGATASPKSVPALDLDIEDGPSWVVDLRKEHDFQVVAMSGKLATGGRLAGHVTGQRTSDGKPYSFDLTFDLALPAKSAAAGVDCSALH